MSTYFPYSQIIQNICSDIKQGIKRHSFFGEWSVVESEKTQTKNSNVQISELYY